MIGIGLEHIWCRPAFFFIASTCPTRQSCGHNLRYNLYNVEEEREKERQRGKYCVRGVQRCKEPVPKASGYIHQNAFRRGPHRKCKPVTFNWNTGHLTGWSLIVVVGLIVEHRVYGSVNNFNILLEFYFIPSRCFSFSLVVLRSSFRFTIIFFENTIKSLSLLHYARLEIIFG